MRCARRSRRAHRHQSGIAFELSDLLGLVLDPILGAVQLFLLLAFGFFLAALATKRRIAGEIAGGLLRPAGHLVYEAHGITSGALLPSRPDGQTAPTPTRTPLRPGQPRAACEAPCA